MAPKIDPGRAGEATCVKRGSKDAFWHDFGPILVPFWYLFGAFLEYILADVTSFLWRVFSSLEYETLRIITTQLHEVCTHGS